MDRPSGTDIVCVDIGNSAIKLGLSNAAGSGDWNSISRIDSSPETGYENNELIQSLKQEPYSWFVASVNQETSRSLEKWVNANRPEDCFRLLTNQDVLLEVVPPIESIGSDRLMAMQGADDLSNVEDSSCSLIVIDAGTAVTVDAADCTRKFLGGTIRPGIKLQCSALHDYTAALPDLSAADFVMPKQVIGQSTEEAILAGTVLGELGAIMGLVQLMDDQLTGPTKVFVTGGGASWMKDLLPDEWRFEPTLVLHGIRVIARQNP